MVANALARRYLTRRRGCRLPVALPPHEARRVGGPISVRVAGARGGCVAPAAQCGPVVWYQGRVVVVGYRVRLPPTARVDDPVSMAWCRDRIHASCCAMGRQPWRVFVFGLP